MFIITGFFETFGAGWIYNMDHQLATLGKGAVFSYMGAHFLSIIVACGLWFGLDNDSAVWAGFVAFFICFIVGLSATAFFLSKKIQEEPDTWTWSSIIRELCLGNVMHLRDELSSVVGYLPWLWAFAMKNLIPQILLILFINLATSKNDDGESLFGHYEGYVAAPFQVLGILCVCFAAVLILIGAVRPQTFEAADIPYMKAKAKAEELDEKVVDGSDEAEEMAA